jgi:hypothetical protein
MEISRILFFFWCDVFIGLQDAVNAGDVDAAAVGRRVVLPSSYVSGPRYMHVTVS